VKRRNNEVSFGRPSASRWLATGMRHAPDRVVQGLAHGQRLHRPLGLGRFDRLVAACDALS
jgi:hypothetical protein